MGRAMLFASGRTPSTTPARTHSSLLNSPSIRCPDDRAAPRTTAECVRVGARLVVYATMLPPPPHAVHADAARCIVVRMLRDSCGGAGCIGKYTLHGQRARYCRAFGWCLGQAHQPGGCLSLQRVVICITSHTVRTRRISGATRHNTARGHHQLSCRRRRRIPTNALVVDYR